MGQLKEHSMPFGMGFGELVLILIIVVVVFGSTKLPQLGDGLGKAIKNFKRAVNSQNELDVSPKEPGKTGGESDGDKPAK
jgi:sec-independent protein translocase protein TatA